MNYYRETNKKEIKGRKYFPHRPKIMALSYENYVIEEGDNLYFLAEKYLGDSSLWYILQEFNGFPDPFLLTPGSNLKIPYNIPNNQYDTTLVL